jgi:hypothetical protein
MSDLTVVAKGGLWMLVDDEDDAELGAFASQAEALAAVEGYARVDFEPRHVLIQEADGDWDEEFVLPPYLH